MKRLITTIVFLFVCSCGGSFFAEEQDDIGRCWYLAGLYLVTGDIDTSYEIFYDTYEQFEYSGYVHEYVDDNLSGGFSYEIIYTPTKDDTDNCVGARCVISTGTHTLILDYENRTVYDQGSCESGCDSDQYTDIATELHIVIPEYYFR